MNEILKNNNNNQNNKIICQPKKDIITIETNNNNNNIDNNKFQEIIEKAINKAMKTVLKDKDVDSVLHMNDDMTLIEDGFLDEMRKLTEDNSGIVCQKSHKRGTHCSMGFTYFPRYVWEDVGEFDEKFKMLEWDDVDMSVRLQEKGYKLLSTEKDYIDHWTSSSAKMMFTDEQNELMRANKKIFKEKWKGTKWENIFR